MKLTKNTKIMVLGSGLLLGLILMNFRPSGSHPAALAKSVSLLDLSGKPLSSVFEGVSIDPRYPEFKRLSEKRSLSCDRRSSSWSRFKAMLGLSFESVVHAQAGCGGCGYDVVYTANCSSDCGGNAYEGDLTAASPDHGTMAGPVVCNAAPYGCPGTSPTIGCSCGPDGGGCQPNTAGCLSSYDCCSGFCDPSIGYACNNVY